MENLTPFTISRKVTSFFLLYLVLSCSGKKSDNQDGTASDSLQMGEEQLLLKDQLPVDVLTTSFDDWSEHWKGVLPDFSIAQMESIYAGELPNIPVPIGEMEVTDYHRKHFEYSPDNKRHVDLYSYKVILQQRSEGLQLDFNTDSQALLYEDDEQDARRLLFMGPAGGIEDAFWLNNDELFISGFGELDKEMLMAPIIWHFKLAADSVYSYQFPNGADYAPESYIIKQFKISENL